MSQLLAFFSGVGVSLVAAVIAHTLTRQRDRRRRFEEHRFGIYMKLMELHAQYFWFTTAEFHGESVADEIRQKCRDITWRLADMLRATDEVEYLEDILDVLMNRGFKAAKDRHDAMSELLDRLGERVNPRYAKKMREISEANLRTLGSGDRSNAPFEFRGH